MPEHNKVPPFSKCEKSKSEYLIIIFDEIFAKIKSNFKFSLIDSIDPKLRSMSNNLDNSIFCFDEIIASSSVSIA